MFTLRLNNSWSAFVDLTRVVAISTFALVFNYSVTNIAAYKLKNGFRLQRLIPLLGLATRILLLGFVLFASPQSWLIGVIFLIVGTVYYLARKRSQGKAEKEF